MPSRIWFANTILNKSDSRYDLFEERAMRFGHGVFTTLLYDGGHLHDSSLHYARLCAHAVKFGLSCPFDEEEFSNALSALTYDMREGMALRVSVTGGYGGRGLDKAKEQVSQWYVTASPLNNVRQSSLTLGVSDICRNETSPLAFIKSLNYGDMILAKEAGRKQGWDDVLLLNTRGLLTCASVANVFVKIRGRGWMTPRLRDGVMDGITRAKVLSQHSFIKEHPIDADMLRNAEAMALSNSLKGIQAVKLFWLDGSCFDLDEGAAQEIAIDSQSAGE